MTPIEETYDEVRALITHICRIFQNRHGGMLDELVSTANVVYMDVYKDWEPGSSPFKNYLCLCIYRRLFGEWRHERRRGSVDYDVGLISDNHLSPFSIDDFSADLSEDSREVINIVFNPPESVQEATRAKGGTERNFRTCIREYLKAKGWGHKRVCESFQEISGLLEAA